MNRRAKIVGTLGPSSDSIEMIEKLILEGLNVARINMSHGTHDAHKKVIQNIRKASQNTGYEVAILCDLQGPKIRVDKLKENLELKKDELWALGSEETKIPKSFKTKFIPTVYKDLVSDAKVGARVLFDDGLMEAIVEKKEKHHLEIKIIEGGELKSNKGINLPDINVSAPSLTEKDKEDLLFGLQNDVDYVALSFVRTADDVKQVKYLLHKLKVNTPIIAKIEKPEAIENIESIIQVSDCIMIARGDMGVEVGNHLVPQIQKRIIKLCNTVGKPVITATQMLESMTTNSRPTRAEANDVANAIWDGTDAVMLSGETASGKYPVHSVKMMSQIVIEAEKNPSERPLLRNTDLRSISASLQVASSLVAEKTNSRWVISITQSGSSCLKMSRFRPKLRVLGVTNSIFVIRQMCLYWGITPYFFKVDHENINSLPDQMIEQLKKQKLVDIGDKVVITHGDGKYFKQGTSNSIRVEIIKENEDLQVKDHSFQEEEIEGGRIILDTTICASCQNCVQVCPHDIWQYDQKTGTSIDPKSAKSCTKDMECVNKCPTGAIEIITSDI